MSGLIPTFTLSDLSRTVDDHIKKIYEEQFMILSYIGIECVKWARENHGYEDRSGNLTSSIGYAIISNGEIKSSAIKGAGQGAEIVSQLSKDYPEGMILVVVAGMEYAAAVESKGYDVITGSSFECEKLMNYMSQQLGIHFS